jgi:tetratricopeptide (TPR) repeat protein
VAAISLLAFSAVGTVAYMSTTGDCDRKAQRSSTASPVVHACEGLRDALGDQSQWSEADWARYATCFENHGHSRLTIKVASQGLDAYPRSEFLTNMKGYHEIALDRHEEAVDTLRTGLDRIGSPFSGVLHNNLAWAGLWAPREVSMDQARDLYTKALNKSPNTCAYIHTGLWVEYAQSTQSDGVRKFQALRNFDSLRARYEQCLDRLDTADWKTMTEVAGAAVLFERADNSDQQDRLSASNDKTSGDELLRRVARQLDKRFHGVNIDAVCQEAMPLATTHHRCAEELGQALKTVRSNHHGRTARGGSGGGGCAATIN